MKAKKTFIFLFGVISIIVICIAWLMIMLLKNQNDLLESQNIRHNSFIIGDELRQSSDDLTNYCRMYVMTGDSIWEKKYWEVLAIRNGESPRPDGNQFALQDSMHNLGFTAHEFDLLISSEAYSNKLVWTEKVAFHAMKGKFADSSNIFSIKNIPNIKYAQKIMFDEDYLLAKENIMLPIDDFIGHIEDRNNETVDGYISKGYNLLALIIVLMLMLMLFSSISYRLSRKKLNEKTKAERELFKAKEKAEESDRLKTAFLANMSHEIRTPMNGIIGFTDLLKEPKLTGEEQEKYIGVIESSGQRLLITVNNLIDISKIESGQMKVVVSEIDISELIEELFTFFNSEAQKKGLQFLLSTISLNKNIILLSDQEKIYSILTNLIKNAIKYTQNGSIDFGYKIEGNNLQFFVKDTGNGIPTERLEAIFDRFIRNDLYEDGVSEGSGLGLSIAKAYVEMLGGKIWVESEVGVGSQFNFTIPYKEVRSETSKNKEGKSESISKSQIKGLKILIVEDDEAANNLLSILVRNISKEVLRTKNGLEAVELSRTNSDIDLILMDIQMPGINGYEATKLIREFNKDVVIIAQTAFALTGDRETSIEAGCNDYISKPINKIELLEKIENCLTPCR